jgi:hypothetical protein
MTLCRTVLMFYFLNLIFHSLPVSQKAVLAKSVPALPFLTWEPECSCESRRVAGVEESEAGYALPCCIIENVARFVGGVHRVMWKIEIDDVVAARQLDLHACQWGRRSALEGIKADVVHRFFLVQIVQAYRNMSRSQGS